MVLKKLNNTAYRSFLRTVFFCTAALLLAAGTVSADDMLPSLELDEEDVETVDHDVSDEELRLFGIAVVGFQEIQVQANEYIEAIIDESELSEQRIEELMQLQHMQPGSLEEEASSEELEEFEHTLEEVAAVHEAAQEEMVGFVDELGFELDEFNELAETIQNDPQLLVKLQQMFSE